MVEKKQIDPKHMTEDVVTKTLYEELCRDQSLLVARKWKGWSIRGTQERAEKQLFDREFDIAVFERGPRRLSSPFYEIGLTGYEIKGCTEKRGAPPFMDGLDQALVLLFQHADLAYLVYPDLEEQIRKRMRQLCDRYAPDVGLKFLQANGTFWEFRKPRRNQHTTLDIKRDLLAKFLTSGNASARRIPDWARAGDYG